MSTRKAYRDDLLSRQIQLRKHEIPEGWSFESADLINKVIERMWDIYIYIYIYIVLAKKPSEQTWITGTNGNQAASLATGF